MARSPRPERRLTTVRILALISVSLAAMCAILAWAWKNEREAAACWRAAAEFQLQIDDVCQS